MTSGSDLVSARVKELRKARGWTAQELADRCAAAGAPYLTTSVIANIETGRRTESGRRRRDVTIDEVLALAHVLSAPVLRMFLPIEAGEVLDVTEQTSYAPLRAYLWASAEIEPVDPAEDHQAFRRSRVPLLRYRELHVQFDEAARLEALEGREAEFRMQLQQVARAWELAADGGLEVPGLPPAWVAEMREHGWLGPDVEVPLRDDWPGFSDGR